MHIKSESCSCPTLCNPMNYIVLNSPDQNTGVGSLSLLQRTFPTQELNWGLRIAGSFFTSWATREAHLYMQVAIFVNKTIEPLTKEKTFGKTRGYKRILTTEMVIECYYTTRAGETVSGIQKLAGLTLFLKKKKKLLFVTALHPGCREWALLSSRAQWTLRGRVLSCCRGQSLGLWGQECGMLA